MANFIYLKTSAEPPLNGDLTPTGIVTRVYFPRIYTEDRIYENSTPTVLLPMLIIDALEEPGFGGNEYFSETGWRDDEAWKKDHAIWEVSRIGLKDSVIPFHSNEQVYEWLKSKGITPEADGLYEFDAEFELKHECISHHCNDDDYKTGCNLCEKVSIIKPTANQESENDMFREVVSIVLNSTNVIIELKEKFKIQRR